MESALGINKLRAAFAGQTPTQQQVQDFIASGGMAPDLTSAHKKEWAQIVGSAALAVGGVGMLGGDVGFGAGAGFGGATSAPVYGGSAVGTDLGAVGGAGGFAGDATAWGYGGAADAMGSTGASTMGMGGAGASGGGLFGSAGSALGGGGGTGVAGTGVSWQDALLKAGVNGVGGLLSNNAASGAASGAAAAAKFRPVGVTSRFGGSGFQFDADGNLVGAGYSLSPDAAALRDRMMAGTGQDLNAADQASGAAQGLFGLGSRYMSGNPAQAWMDRQQKLLQPSRERSLSDLQAKLFASGRLGLATGGTSTQAASNPEMQAYFNSLQQQDAGLAAQAEEQGRASVNFGTGLFKNGMDLMNTRYNPALSSAAGANTIEGYGQDTLNMGAQLGGRSAQAGSNAAPWQYKANATSPAGAFFTGMGSGGGLSWDNLTSGYNALKGLWTS